MERRTKLGDEGKAKAGDEAEYISAPPVYFCAKCSKPGGGKGVKFYVCSVCKKTWYCSVECQRSDYRFHKPHCLHHFKFKEEAKRDGFKRELRLLNNWTEKVHPGLTYICRSLFGFEFLRNLFSQRIVILFQVAFDYNFRTFMPKEFPKLYTPEDLDRTCPKLAHHIRNKLLEMEENIEEEKVLILVCKRCNRKKGISAFLTTVLGKGDNNIKRNTWVDFLHYIRAVGRLKSKIFHSWLPLQRDNLNAQIQAIRRRPEYRTFVWNALNIQSGKSKHKTHIVVIFIHMGNGLGEVEAIKCYDVPPVSRVIATYEALTGIPPDQVEHDKKYILDLEESPLLLGFRKKRPHVALLPVLFLADPEYGVHKLIPELWDVPPGLERCATPKLNEKAKKALEGLRDTDFPPVESPALD